MWMKLKIKISLKRITLIFNFANQSHSILSRLLIKIPPPQQKSVTLEDHTAIIKSSNFP